MKSLGQESMSMFSFEVTYGRVSGCWTLKAILGALKGHAIYSPVCYSSCWTTDTNIDTKAMHFWHVAGWEHPASLCDSFLVPPTNLLKHICCHYTWNIQPHLIFSMSQGYKDGRSNFLREASSLLRKHYLGKWRQVAVPYRKWWNKGNRVSIPEKTRRTFSVGLLGVEGWLGSF